MPVYKTTSKDGTITYYVQFYYKDFSGKLRHKKKRGFAKKSDAKAFEEEFKRRAANAPDMTFQSMYDIYIDDCRKHLKPTTVFQKEFTFKSKILPFFKDRPINSITAADVRLWQNKQLETSNSSSYVKHNQAQLSSIFNFAVKYYNLPKNPCRAAASELYNKKEPKKIDFWTRDEFDKFISNAKNPMYYCGFNILFWTGCRIGELLALTPGDFDFEGKTMSITKNVARLNKKDIVQTPKTYKSTRTVVIPDFLIKIIKNYIKNHMYQPDQNTRLFPVIRSMFERFQKRTAETAGIKQIRLHDLRHSHASLMIELGCSPLLLQERLGHEKIQTTLQTYSHLYPNKQTELANKLQELINPAKSK